MKLKTLFFAAAALFVSMAVSAQVVVNEMPKGSAQEDYFKAYDGVSVGLVGGDFKAQGDYNYAGLKSTGSAYMAITADKKIKAVRLYATGNSQNAAFNAAVIGFKEAPEAVVTDGKLQVVDFAAAVDGKAGKQQYDEAVWLTIDLDTVDLKAVYISRQWKKIALSEEDKNGGNVGAQSQTIRVFGFQVVLDGQEMPAIPDKPVVVEDPAITKFVVAGVEAKIDQKNKTITAEVPFGTNLAEALAAAEIEDNQEEVDPVLDAEAMTLALGELVYTLKITVAADPDAPSTNVVLVEALFSNGAKAFIDNKEAANTAVVPYIGEKPTFVSGRNEDGKAKVSVEGDKIIVENGEAKAEYALTFQEYSAAPLETGAEPYVFTGEEIGVWIASVYKWDAEKGIKFAKDVEEEKNRRISEGKDRVYFFLPAADSVRLVSGSGANRPVKVLVNGVLNEEVTVTAKSGEAISIALGNVPALVAIESNGSSGDAGFTSIQLVKAGEVTPPQPETPAITKVTVAGVAAVIDQEAKTIAVELAWDADLEAALQDVVIEDNQEEAEPVLDLENMTVTIVDVVYSLSVTLAEKPVEPDPLPTGTAIFYWQATDEQPANGDVVDALGGTLTVQSTDESKTVSPESAKYVDAVPDDMKAAGTKGWKLSGNALSFELRLSEGSFLAGDVILISGYKGWRVSSTAEHTGDLAAEIATGDDKNNYKVGYATLPADAEVLYLMRAQGTGTAAAAIKVLRNIETALVDNTDSEVYFANGMIYNPAHTMITVYSVNGAVVTMSNDNINLNTMPSGLYIVRNGDKALKVVK